MEDQDNDFEMQPVVGSSRLAALGHSGDRLKARFPNGRECVYSGVPEEVFQTVMSAPSVGSAFGNLIVNGGYPFEYVG